MAYLWLCIGAQFQTYVLMNNNTKFDKEIKHLTRQELNQNRKKYKKYFNNKNADFYKASSFQRFMFLNRLFIKRLIYFWNITLKPTLQNINY